MIGTRLESLENLSFKHFKLNQSQQVLEATYEPPPIDFAKTFKQVQYFLK